MTRLSDEPRHLSTSAAWRRARLMPAALAFAVMLGTVVAAILLNNRVIAAVEQARELVIRANAQADGVRRIMSALNNIETGEQGFLLTGAATDLGLYETGRQDVGGALDRLDTLVVATPELHDGVQVLRELAGKQVSESARLVALAQGHGREAAIAALQTGSATAHLVRERAADLQRRIGEDHERRLAEVRARETTASRAGVASAVVCAALLGAAVLVLLRGRARLQRAQQDLRDQTARLSGTVAHMRDAIAMFGHDGGLRLWNQKFADLAQLPEGPLRLGTPISRIVVTCWPGVPTELPAHGAPSLHEAHIDQQSFEVWRGRMPDGGYILLVADTTRRSRAETIARQAQKMEALGQLTGGVAHDFNNLLQVVSANLELVVMRLTGNAAVTDRLAAALGAVERASQLTRHLLAFARRQPLAPEAIDTAGLLTGLEDMLRRALGGSVRLNLTLDPALWPIRADPQQLENAILNLAINGRDAMAGQDGPGLGSLEIEASNTELDDDDAARMPGIVAGPYVAIAITDTGIGMTAEELGRAVEPFYTTKPEGRGTGLGLPMVFGFAQQSQGHLQLQSRPGHGTTARLYLPRSASQPQQRPERAALLEPSRGELVLVVEDDATVRATSCQALRSLGYRTAEAADAAAALDLLRQGLRPQLLFTDVVMPGQPDAQAMAAQARQLIPGLAVVYTSAFADAAMVQGGRLDPGVRLIGKPWRTAELGRQLGQALLEAHEALPRGLRVVLAEDDRLVRMTTAELLADLGHEVIEASTGMAALRVIDAACDLLITDLGLPDMDGLQLAERAAEARPELPVVVASGRERDPSSRHTWLQKPYDAAALRVAIDRAVMA